MAATSARVAGFVRAGLARVGFATRARRCRFSFSELIAAYYLKNRSCGAFQLETLGKRYLQYAIVHMFWVQVKRLGALAEGTRKMEMKRLLGVAAVIACGAAVAGAAPLRSPWDARVVKVSDGSYSCPALKPLPKDIAASDYYTDAKHSVIDQKRLAAYQ